MIKRAVFHLLAFILVLCVLEAGLVFTGRMLEAPQLIQNKIEKDDAKRLRILTLGESTSADYCHTVDKGVCKPWPRQLEAMLWARGVDARVYNEAVPGISTPFVLKHLPAWIRMYRPQIVVSMIGVNDIRLRPVVSADFFSGLHIFRIAKWSRDALFGPKLRPDDQLKWGQEFHQAFNQAGLIPMERWDSEVPGLVEKLPVEQQGLIWGQLGNYCEGYSQVNSQIPLSLCRKYAEKGYALAPADRQVIAFLIYIARKAGDIVRVEEIAAEILRNRVSLTDEILTQFMSFDPKQHPNSWKLLREYGIEPGDESQSPATLLTQRLLQIQKTIEEAGLTHLRMQYPTLPIEDLAHRYNIPAGADLAGLGFIENKENFRRALSNHNFEEVFADKFEESWGHTTHYGHSLIAEQVANRILDLPEARLVKRGL